MATVEFQVEFVDVKFASCCKDLEVVYHVLSSSITADCRHYIALQEEHGNQNEFSRVWVGKTMLLEQERKGTIMKWQKGKVVFSSHALPARASKPFHGHKYCLMYCNEDGAILGKCFIFWGGSDNVAMIHKAPTTISESNSEVNEMLSEGQDCSVRHSASHSHGGTTCKAAVHVNVDPSQYQGLEGEDTKYSHEFNNTKKSYQNMLHESTSSTSSTSAVVCGSTMEVMGEQKNIALKDDTGSKFIPLKEIIALLQRMISNVEKKSDGVQIIDVKLIHAELQKLCDQLKREIQGNMTCI